MCRHVGRRCCRCCRRNVRSRGLRRCLSSSCHTTPSTTPPPPCQHTGAAESNPPSLSRIRRHAPRTRGTNIAACPRGPARDPRLPARPTQRRRSVQMSHLTLQKCRVRQTPPKGGVAVRRVPAARGRRRRPLPQRRRCARRRRARRRCRRAGRCPALRATVRPASRHRRRRGRRCRSPQRRERRWRV